MKTKSNTADSYLLAGLFLVTNVVPFVVGPKFEAIFATMWKGRPLPGLTQLLLALTPWCWLLISIALAVLILAKDRKKWRLPNPLFALLLICGLMATVVALFLPVVSTGPLISPTR